MNSKTFKLIFWGGILLILLISVALFSLSAGPANIPINKIIRFSFENNIEHTIIFNIRLPRILLAIVVGGGLSVAGLIFQAMFRNPLVEPYTLGVSGGAALMVALFIVFGLGIFLPIAGFIGALTVIILVYFITAKRGTWNINTVLLTGIMFSFIASSLIMLIMALSKTAQLREIVFWIMGSLEETHWHTIGIVSTILILGTLITFMLSNELNAITLGEEEALHLGINVEFIKKIFFILVSIIAGFVVSISGVIGFVGLVVPHFMKMIFGRDHRILVPVSFLGGGIFLLSCDTIARTIIAPQELPVGVVTGIIGGIAFIYFLSRKPKAFGGSPPHQ